MNRTGSSGSLGATSIKSNASGSGGNTSGNAGNTSYSGSERAQSPSHSPSSSGSLNSQISSAYTATSQAVHQQAQGQHVQQSNPSRASGFLSSLANSARNSVGGGGGGGSHSNSSNNASQERQQQQASSTPPPATRGGPLADQQHTPGNINPGTLSKTTPSIIVSPENVSYSSKYQQQEDYVSIYSLKADPRSRSYFRLNSPNS